MAFPPSLSKEQRKMMHGLAEAHRLPTFSRVRDIPYAYSRQGGVRGAWGRQGV